MDIDSGESDAAGTVEFERVSLVGDVATDSTASDRIPASQSSTLAQPTCDMGGLFGLDLPVGSEWDNLQTLLELHELGEPVSWPNGFDARTAALALQQGARRC